MADVNPELRRQSRRLFGMLRAIVRRGEHAGSADDFAARLEGRIGALARAHDMLLRAPAAGVDLEELVNAELIAQAIPAARCSVSGPDTRLGGHALLALALAVHELAINAIAHGTLTQPPGTLEVTWHHERRADSDRLRIVWQERGSAQRPSPPASKGFGLELIESMLPYELDAGTQVAWLEPGARVEIDVPTSERAANWMPGARSPA